MDSLALKNLADRLYKRNGELYSQKRYKRKILKAMYSKMNKRATEGGYSIKVYDDNVDKKFPMLYRTDAKVPIELFDYVVEELEGKGFEVLIKIDPVTRFKFIDVSWK